MEPVSASPDYRDSHVRDDQVAWYEHGAYAPGSYDDWLWEREKPVLSDVIDRHLGGRDVRFLDFACGTGRILSFLEPRVADATGVDISEKMLALAKSKVERAALICGDVTQDASLLAGPFDLITAFRFFQNAQESLRDQALERLAASLAPDGVLVFNIHGNLWSPRLPSYLARRFVLRQEIAQLSIGHARQSLARHRLRLVEFHGISLFTPRAYRRLGAETAERVDRVLRRSPSLQRFAVDVILVATH